FTVGVTRPLRLLAAVVLCVLALPGAAVASDQQLSMMMDDDLLVYRDDATRDAAMARMKQLGVDYVRVTVLWSVVAEHAKSTPARRRRFDPRDPRTYPTRNWDRYDRLVRSARTLGLGVYFNVTPPGPPWSRGRAPRGLRDVVRRAWKPDAGEFAKFVEAVGRRFSGNYRDENDARAPIPRVSFWSLLNEPNQGGWLAPQYERGRMRSPSLARELFLRGRAALDRTGHGRDTILFGETAPLGSSLRNTTSPIRPKRWYREFLCESARGPKCNLFEKYGPIRATGIAHHPYTKNVSPLVRDPHPDAITMANLSHLTDLVDSLARRTGNVDRGLPAYMTEFGFETNPPDPFSGVPVARQAEWNMLGDFLAYTNPRVASMTQFLLRDVAPVASAPRRSKAYWFTYQSGLYFNDDTPKPAAIAYYFPFLASGAGPGSANVWGQTRFRPNALPPGTQDSVQLQHLAPGSREWTNVGAPIVVTNPMGYFTANVRYPGPGQLRATVGAPLPVPSLPQPVG
ncbi:MAG TPA: hypothetical protein VHF89_21260, partial [Solirubrobacteraceae bacterium]|nr:hypothetical protein [Solirubrobacteraceae bacterium]